MKTIIVNDKFNNKKLMSLLFDEFPNSSKNIFYKALRQKDIRINNHKVSENVLLHTGDEIKIYIPDSLLDNINFTPEILYEDEYILVLNKPKGIEVTGNNSLSLLLNKLMNYSYIEPCHRLDRNTTGIVIFAKSKIALDILNEKFKTQEITKFYKCKVCGIMNKKHDILKAYLFKDRKKSIVYISNMKKKGYREIITEYMVLEENLSKQFSILEVILHTGKTHQIRAHLSFIGHPIIGDRKIWG